MIKYPWNNDISKQSNRKALITSLNTCWSNNWKKRWNKLYRDHLYFLSYQDSSRFIIGLFPELIYYILTLILCKARFSNFCWLYWSTFSIFKYFWSLIVPSCWSICIFFAIIDLVLPFLGSLSNKFKAGEVPNILFLINFLSLIKLPFSPSMSDSRKINLPLMFPWSNNF